MQKERNGNLAKILDHIAIYLQNRPCGLDPFCINLIVKSEAQMTYRDLLTLKISNGGTFGRLLTRN
jgi:hypothetical protein